MSAVLLLCTLATPIAPAAATPPSRNRYVVALGSDEVAQVIAAHGRGLAVGRRYSSVFHGFAARMTVQTAAALRLDPRVVAVEPDAAVPYAGAQGSPPWGLDRIDQRRRPLNNTYAYANRGRGVTAYVVDSGIYRRHRDFRDRLHSGFSVTNNGSLRDCIGHGTHVAGTIGGRRFGVAKGVRLVSVRVGGCKPYVLLSDMLAGLDFVRRDHERGRPAVVNMSLGGWSSTVADRAVNRLIDEGVSVVVAAGNAGQNACDTAPARVPRALTVGAVNAHDRAPEWSNGGPCVDLFAPGVGIRSAAPGGPRDSRVSSGTSMAAPHVTGVVARYLAAHSQMDANVVAHEVLRAATPDIVRDAGRSTTQRLLFKRGRVPTRMRADTTGLVDEWGARVPIGGALTNRVTGAALAGKRVDLYRYRHRDARWRRVDRGRTNSRGRVEFRKRADAPTEYRLRHPGSATTLPKNSVNTHVDFFPADTSLRLRASDDEINPGETVRMTAVLTRDHDGARLAGQTVHLAGDSGGIDMQAKTDERGRATFTVIPAQTTRYRAYYDDTRRTHSSVSNRVEVTVTIP